MPCNQVKAAENLLNNSEVRQKDAANRVQEALQVMLTLDMKDTNTGPSNPPTLDIVISQFSYGTPSAATPRP